MTEPQQTDIVSEARQLLAKIPAGMAMPDAPLLSKSLSLLRQLCDEVERLRGISNTLEDIYKCDKCDLCEDH